MAALRTNDSAAAFAPERGEAAASVRVIHIKNSLTSVIFFLNHLRDLFSVTMLSNSFPLGYA
jgi:hypothetical protein